MLFAARQLTKTDSPFGGIFNSDIPRLPLAEAYKKVPSAACPGSPGEVAPEVRPKPGYLFPYAPDLLFRFAPGPPSL